jgi:hypothetical protein
MEKRTYKRIPVGIGADIISGNIHSAAFIGNFSAYGLYLITIHMEDAIDFTLKTEIELLFQIHTGENLNLHCKKIWSSTITSRSLLQGIGLEIIQPPIRYKEILCDLYIKSHCSENNQQKFING